MDYNHLLLPDGDLNKIIVSYKFSCVSWQTLPNGNVDKSTEKVDEKFFFNPSPIIARREGRQYFITHLENILALEESTGKIGIPPVAYHLRLYFVLDDNVRYPIYSKANYEMQDYNDERLLPCLDYEVQLYKAHGYDTGGEIQYLKAPNLKPLYRLLYDTAVDARKSIEQKE